MSKTTSVEAEVAEVLAARQAALADEARAEVLARRDAERRERERQAALAAAREQLAGLDESQIATLEDRARTALADLVAACVAWNRTIDEVLAVKGPDPNVFEGYEVTLGDVTRRRQWLTRRVADLARAVLVEHGGVPGYPSLDRPED